LRREANTHINLVIPHQGQLRQPRAYIPLGLAYIGAVLEQSGHEVSITDLNDGNVKGEADIYGITATTATYENAVKTALNLENERVVMGGIHVSIFPKKTLCDTVCDHVIVGEGEYAFRDLANGVIKNRIIQAGYIEDLDALPLPARHLFNNVVDYSGIHGQERGVGATTLISSRGCPYHCAFCTKITQTSKVRFHSPKRMIEEIKDVMRNYNVSHFRFVDDIFTLSRKRIEKFCEFSAGLDFTFICITRGDALDNHLLKKMRRAGCLEVHIGVESGSQRILDAMNKQTMVKVLEEAIRKIKDAGIRVKTYLMYGFLGEEKEDREKTIEFVKRTRPDKVTVSKFTPLPGSTAWHETQEHWFYPEEEDYLEFKKGIKDVLT